MPVLDRIILFHKDEMFPKPEIAPPDEEREGMDFITFGVLLAADADGTLQLQGNVTISDDVLSYAVDAVLGSGEGSGTVRDLGLRFIIRETPDGTRIAFADMTGGYARIRTLTLMLVGIGAAGAAVAVPGQPRTGRPRAQPGRESMGAAAPVRGGRVA